MTLARVYGDDPGDGDLARAQNVTTVESNGSQTTRLLDEILGSQSTSVTYQIEIFGLVVPIARTSEPRDRSESVSDPLSAFYHPAPLVALVRSAGSSPHNHHAVYRASVVFVRYEEENFGPCRSQQRPQKDLGPAVRS